MPKASIPKTRHMQESGMEKSSSENKKRELEEMRGVIKLKRGVAASTCGRAEVEALKTNLGSTFCETRGPI